ncbi:C40 family peptidase [Halobacillus faecis]|uniref:C40 family peptidase n=1 Tax=Halobacillus faecis TaxID=360184 RepID=UPI003FCD62A1
MEGSSYWGPRYTEARRVEEPPVVKIPDPTNELAVEAMKYIGSPHQTGGETPEGFDSSGFVQYVVSQVLDFLMPRTLDSQLDYGDEVARDQIQEGDVLYFEDEEGSVSHAAIYVGDDQMVHPSVSEGVEVTSFEKDSYWSGRFLTARRITEGPDIAEENDIVATALQYLGIPYLFGGETPEEGFDCSAFTRYVFEEARNIFLPRSTDQQWSVGQDIALENIQVGDVIFFSDTYREGISHNGIYVGDGKFIHASRSKQVTLAYLSDAYWQEKFTGVKRFTGLEIPKENPIVSEATKYIGEVDYSSGGATPEGFDTAGFVQYAYKQGAGIDIPRYAESQWEIGESVDKGNLQPGDIVFFESSYLNPAIYIGNEQVVHVTLSKGVTVTNMNTNGYWAPKYYGAKRVTK